MIMRNMTLPHSSCLHGVSLMMLQQNHHPAPIPGVCLVDIPASVEKTITMLSLVMRTRRRLECSIATV